MWPQYLYLGMVLLGLGISLGTHGQERAPENFFVTFPVSVFVLWILYMGGFFSTLF